MSKLRPGPALALTLTMWIPALLLSAFISYIAGYVGTGFAPLRIAVPFLLVFPCVLLALASFRLSAITVAALLAWDVVVTTWPHITLAGFFDSVIDIFLLVTTMLTAIPAMIAPSTSLVKLVRKVTNE